ncbi:hypothetical protein [Salinisphaera sp. Q1T1-3]|uniref:hypothetical protein n=1 Tax=Salinisphaera sp. Q1T1-3 TaxID=2321229 RepID=UPI000E763AC9|nr:hypothetical protein [Salinisphaera sp. Q1T1-3]RJS94152.1 hypothetical protein D3260_06215 [Salinisphaera sp. Q1T1-3]
MAEPDSNDARIARLQARLADNETRQADLWQQFADARAQSLAAGRIAGALTRSDRRMLELRDARHAHGQAIERAWQEQAQRESRRTEVLAAAREPAETAAAAHAACRAAVEGELQADADYRRAAQDYERTRQTLSDLQDRLTDARAELEAKRGAFEQDRLFVYLLNRGYASQHYARWGWARRIDDWIATIVDFNNAYADYSLLKDMPAWLEENITRITALKATHEQALARHWEQAARASELRRLRDRAEQARLEAEQQAETVAQERARDAALIAARDDYRAQNDTYAQQMRDIYRQSFRDQPLSALRSLAAQTATDLDARAVDSLARLQREHADLCQRLASLSDDDDDDDSVS